MTTRTPPDGLADLLDEIKAAQLPPPLDRRRIRERAGLSCREVARVLDVNPMSVVRWEQGDMPKRAHAIRYRQLLDALVEHLDNEAESDATPSDSDVAS